MTDAGPAAVRLVAIADSDSYVKWAAALVGSVPDADAALGLVTTPLTVSEAQQAKALAGSGLTADVVHRVALDDLRSWLEQHRPDAVILGARGPLVRVLAKVVAAVSPRPVIVTGLPGISLPARRAAVIYRAQCDLFILHSQREIEEFGELTQRVGIPHRFALSRLPFAATRIGHRSPGATDLVFAAQAIVPRERAERETIARMLIRAAEANPTRRVVLKLRAQSGERETHEELHPYPALIDAAGGAPANLVISYEPMVRALDRAEGLVTVSSTSAIEAIARGVPVIALDSFGVSDELLNRVFEGSGLYGGEGDVVARWFRHPDTDWLRENYFHEEVFDDWVDALTALVGERRAGLLPARAPRPGAGGRLRDAWERKRVLGREDRSMIGRVALLVGEPARGAVLALRRVRGRWGRGAVVGGGGAGAGAVAGAGQQPGPDGSSEHVSSTSAVRTSTTRTS